MKKLLWRLLVVAIIVLGVLRFTGALGTTTPMEDTIPATGTTTTTGNTDEVTADDLKMIEDFLDEIVDAVEQEEANQ